MEDSWYLESSPASGIKEVSPPQHTFTIHMDGVFDLSHIGHLEAIKHCTKLANKVIIGVTGQQDASGCKQEPIIAESERVAIISTIKGVDYVICPLYGRPQH